MKMAKSRRRKTDLTLR